MGFSALIIVDVQNDFCPGGSLAVPDGDAVVPVINRVSSRFPVVVATRDWHPEGHVSFASAHDGRSPGDLITAGSIEQMLWPDHCVQSTPGSAFHPELDIRPVNMIIHKGTSRTLDSYSGFLETDRKTETGLRGYLAGLGVDEVTVCGLATDYCVCFTTIDARHAGFTTRLLTDACRGINSPTGNLNRAIEHMRNEGVIFVESSELE